MPQRHLQGSAIFTPEHNTDGIPLSLMMYFGDRSPAIAEPGIAVNPKNGINNIDLELDPNTVAGFQVSEKYVNYAVYGNQAIPGLTTNASDTTGITVDPAGTVTADTILLGKDVNTLLNDNLRFIPPVLPNGTDAYAYLSGTLPMQTIPDHKAAGTYWFGQDNPFIPPTGTAPQLTDSYDFLTLITSPPSVTGDNNPATDDLTPVHLFPNIAIADNPDLPGGAKDSAVIKITGGGTLSGSGVTAVDAHTFAVSATDPSALGKLLQSVVFTPDALTSGQSALVHIGLDITNNLPTPLTTSDQNTTVLVAGTHSMTAPSYTMDMMHQIG